jgi:hypothetical protein
VTRLWVLTAVLLALALAGCGPDCDKYCSKLAQCASQAGRSFDQAGCVLGCNDSGSDKSHTISCVIDHDCTDLRSGHCVVTGQLPQ